MGTFSELVTGASKYAEPQLIAPLGVRLGGVDPLGLRQINFDLMDLVIPGLNNVARHIRPYTVIAWAWHRAAICARDARRRVTVDDLKDFVDRIEVIFAWSQFLRDEDADLPGHDVLASLVNSESYRFGGNDWTHRRKTREYSTALSAPVNYGPAVKALGWLEPSTASPGALRSSEMVSPALVAFTNVLRDYIAHPAFSRLGAVTVTREEVKNWARSMSMQKITAQEKSAMRESLAGDSAADQIKDAAATITAIWRRTATADPDHIRSRMCHGSRKSVSLKEFEPVPSFWTLVQTRQLFRLALEALLHWVLIKLSDGPRHMPGLARALVAEARRASTTRDWLSTAPFKVGSIPEQINNLERALRDSEGTLALEIQNALAMSLAQMVRSPIQERNDRLPLARAQEEAQSLGAEPPVEFIKHVLGSWILGQHVYWAVGRGLADARSNGRTILRLRIVPEENGWILAPGVGPNLTNPPRPTPDRLSTLVSLMTECGLLN